jgi:hypothetical protein
LVLVVMVGGAMAAEHGFLKRRRNAR